MKISFNKIRLFAQGLPVYKLFIIFPKSRLFFSVIENIQTAVMNKRDTACFHVINSVQHNLCFHK